MSNKYKVGDKVPWDVIVNRLDELSKAATEGKAGWEREFFMSIPAQADRDADFVLARAAELIREKYG